MKKLILYWFKMQAAKTAKVTLQSHFEYNEIQHILDGYWQRYLELKTEIPETATLGGSVVVHLSAMSTAFYHELTARGQNEETTTQLFYDIAWKVYQKMGKFSWWLAGIGNKNGYERLLKATKLFRAFPFNSPSYQWKDVHGNSNVVEFDCVRCPVAEYFQSKNLSDFCVKTWCALDYPLAEMWHARLVRTGCIASGAKKCDFKWVVTTTENK